MKSVHPVLHLICEKCHEPFTWQNKREHGGAIPRFCSAKCRDSRYGKPKRRGEDSNRDERHATIDAGPAHYPNAYFLKVEVVPADDDTAYRPVVFLGPYVIWRDVDSYSTHTEANQAGKVHMVMVLSRMFDA